MNRTTLSRTLLRGGLPAVAIAGLILAGVSSASAEPVAYNGYDGDGDGWHEAYGFDRDGDGLEDAWAFDADRDGSIESVAVDRTGDGRADVWGFDTDRNGYVEQVALDGTGNALPDSWGSDTDLDGDIDTLSTDSDDDGFADASRAVEPSAVPSAIADLAVTAAGWGEWTPRFAYGFGYAYDAVAAARDEAGLPEPASGDPAPAATATTPDATPPDVMVMAGA